MTKLLLKSILMQEKKDCFPKMTSPVIILKGKLIKWILISLKHSLKIKRENHQTKKKSKNLALSKAFGTSTSSSTTKKSSISTMSCLWDLNTKVIRWLLIQIGEKTLSTEESTKSQERRLRKRGWKCCKETTESSERNIKKRNEQIIFFSLS